MEDQSNQQQTWWKKRRKLLIVILIVLILLVTFTLLVLQFGWNWTGFIRPSQNSNFVKVTIKSTNRDIEQQPVKTLWDWLQLLFVPVALAIAGFWLNYLQKSSEDRIAKRQKEIEQETATDNQRENALEEYINKMSDLLLDKDLRASESKSEVRKIARIRTLTVLPRLDGKRKRSILRFLSESALVSKNNPVVPLIGADLSEAQLSKAFLRKTDLKKTNLSKADLSEADLSGANLNGAIGTTPKELDDKTKFLKGTIMPEGFIHT